MKRIIVALVRFIEKASVKRYSAGALVVLLVYLLLAHRNEIPGSIFRYDEQLRDPALAVSTQMNVATQARRSSSYPSTESLGIRITPSVVTPTPVLSSEGQSSSSDSANQNGSSQNAQSGVGGLGESEVTPTSTPTQVVSPTPSQVQPQPLSIGLIPPSESITPQASGQIDIKIVNTYESGFIDVDIEGELSGLKANTVYKLYLCHDTGCSTYSSPQIKTDNLGYVSFVDLGFSYNEQKYPTAAVKVYEEVDSGPVDISNACPAYQVGATPCLLGEVSFN